MIDASPRLYTNPVLDANFPDPAVLRFNGRYYAYGTGPADDGRFFPMLSSTDLVHWTVHGGALEPLGIEGAEEYWAPEVAYSEGRFYLYYATGRTANPDHHLRVAVAEHPLGPWRDAGVNLTPHEIFAIDAHPFRDPADGQWYLFYASDRLTPPFAGTGVVVDRLLAMDRLAAQPAVVQRPYADWQVFELHRAVKFGLDWYTVEGPFVVRHDGQYVCFYSGGRWENPNYGVAYCRAEHPLGPWIDDANADGPTLLTTVPERVIGPGHNSVALGPDLRSRYLFYHGWDPALTARYPRIDRLQWRNGRPVCDGPTWEPQPAPPLPSVLSLFDADEPGPEWDLAGTAWRRARGGLIAVSCSQVALSEPVEDFVAEVSFRAGSGAAGVRVGDTEAELSPVQLTAGGGHASMPDSFRPEAWHTLTLRRRGESLTVTLDEFPTVTTACAPGPSQLALFGSAGVLVGHFALTRRDEE